MYFDPNADSFWKWKPQRPGYSPEKGQEFSSCRPVVNSKQYAVSSPLFSASAKYGPIFSCGSAFISFFSILCSLWPLAEFIKSSLPLPPVPSSCSAGCKCVDYPGTQALVFQFNVLISLHSAILLKVIVPKWLRVIRLLSIVILNAHPLFCGAIFEHIQLRPHSG